MSNEIRSLATPSSVHIERLKPEDVLFVSVCGATATASIVHLSYESSLYTIDTHRLCSTPRARVCLRPVHVFVPNSITWSVWLIQYKNRSIAGKERRGKSNNGLLITRNDDTFPSARAKPAVHNHRTVTNSLCRPLPGSNEKERVSEHDRDRSFTNSNWFIYNCDQSRNTHVEEIHKETIVTKKIFDEANKLSNWLWPSGTHVNAASSSAHTQEEQFVWTHLSTLKNKHRTVPPQIRVLWWKEIVRSFLLEKWQRRNCIGHPQCVLEYL